MKQCEHRCGDNSYLTDRSAGSIFDAEKKENLLCAHDVVHNEHK